MRVPGRLPEPRTATEKRATERRLCAAALSSASPRRFRTHPELPRGSQNICLWAAISVNLGPIESAIYSPPRGRVFGQPPSRPKKKAFRAMAEIGFISLKLKEHNFRAGSQPQRRSPGSSAAAGIDEHLSDPAKTVHELAVNPPRHPRPGLELPHVRVSRNLERNSFPFRNVRPVRRMRQQDAGAIPVYADLPQHLLEVFVSRRLVVRHTDDLQLICLHFFVV